MRHKGRHNLFRRLKENLVMNRILGSLVVFVMLQACGNKAVEPAASILGLWKLVASNDEPVDVNYTIMFRADGGYTFTNTIFDGNQITSEGAWSISGQSITLDTERFTFILHDDTLTLLPANGFGSFTYARE
ncbi:MAG TPA: hypothetical protein DIU35_20210 [Candidatus Latescibacteria bacterium]|nr:hypothetical protein [Candidatus Latescibacterota bacterium]|tara:strand:+ start:1123 stop:1518 length:396 start_codon:yes stop_codon:yes gene_type:complete